MLRRTALFSLIALELFLAATAIFGAIWVVPSQPIALLAGSPFADYTVPAVALGLVGVAALASAALLFVQRRLGVLVSIAIGVAIIVFELVETSVIGLDVWLQPFYVLVGLLIIVLALVLDPIRVKAGHAPALPIIRSLTIAYWVTSLVAACLVVSSVAGLFFGQRGLYEPNPATLPSLLTQDVLSLLVAVPLLLVSMWTARRGSVRGLLLWMGTLFYVAYAYSYTVIGDRLAPLLLVYVAIVSMA